MTEATDSKSRGAQNRGISYPNRRRGIGVETSDEKWAQLKIYLLKLYAEMFLGKHNIYTDIMRNWLKIKHGLV